MFERFTGAFRRERNQSQLEEEEVHRPTEGDFKNKIELEFLPQRERSRETYEGMVRDAVRGAAGESDEFLSTSYPGYTPEDFETLLQRLESIDPSAADGEEVPERRKAA